MSSYNTPVRTKSKPPPPSARPPHSTMQLRSPLSRSISMSSDDSERERATWFSYLLAVFLATQLVSVIYVLAFLNGDPVESDSLDLQATTDAYAGQGGVHKTLLAMAGPPPVVNGAVGAQPCPPAAATSPSNAGSDKYLLAKLSRTSNQLKFLTKEVQRLAAAAPTKEVTPSTAQSIAMWLDKQIAAKQCSRESKLKVLTYNIWNINEAWSDRRARIAMAIMRLQPDVVAIQEIRQDQGTSQLEQLKSMVKGYTSIYLKLRDESIGSEEGIGLLTKLKIESQSHFSVSDNRKVLNAILLGDIGRISFAVAHLGLGANDQCKDAVSIRNGLDKVGAGLPQFIAGDFNTYFDYEWPMDYLTGRSGSFVVSPLNPCGQVFTAEPFHKFQDVWEVSHSKDPGYTFPTFQDQRIQDSSRPDRILWRAPAQPSALDVCDSFVVGGEDMVFLTQDQKIMYPSDHMGLFATFNVKQSLGSGTPPPQPSGPSGDVTQSTTAPTPSAQRHQPSIAEQEQQELQKRRIETDNVPPSVQPTPAQQPQQPSQQPQQPQVQTQKTISTVVRDAIPPRTMPKIAPENKPIDGATVTSSITDYEHAEDRKNHGWQNVYDGDTGTFFWSDRSPSEGDFIEVSLQAPKRAAVAEVLTGSAGGLGGGRTDYLQHGVLEISYVYPNPEGTQYLRTPYIIVASLQDGQAQAQLQPTFPHPQAMVASMRLRCTQNQDSWLIVSEISLK